MAECLVDDLILIFDGKDVLLDGLATLVIDLQNLGNLIVNHEQYFYLWKYR